MKSQLISRFNNIWKFDNSWIHLLPRDSSSDFYQSRQVFDSCWSEAIPTPVSNPKIIAYSVEVAEALDIDDSILDTKEFAQIMAGNILLPGMQTYATCYGGHQFGHWAGQLGDGRVIYLGEIINKKNQRWEIQLKGAGPTPYSRRSDGRAVLRSSMREFLCSEAIFHLGIPTTRALCLVETGDKVSRDMLYDGNPKLEPGAIVCRVAPSFIRFGHFQIAAARNDIELLTQLIEFTLNRDFPQLQGSVRERLTQTFHLICEHTAMLMVEWFRVGFVHGVMNTDNMSILGLTIDYGPYGWMEDFDPSWTPNITDANGRRYCFAQQAAIGRWNLERLAEALLKFLPDKNVFEIGLAHYDSVYESKFLRMLANKFGLLDFKTEDAKWIEQAFAILQKMEIDMTIFFRRLALIDIENPQIEIFQTAFYRLNLLEKHQLDLSQWLNNYAARLRTDNQNPEEKRKIMNATNPKFILRNYLVQIAIDKAEIGEYDYMNELLEIIRHPYDEQLGKEEFSQKRPEWARNKTGCSMLSCSS
ncbi:MAG: YdiU family protein [Pseudomonadota bacterium]